MFIDFAITEIDINDAKIKDLVLDISKHPINSITVPYYLVKICHSLIPQDRINLSCFIDYPLGISDIKTRKFAIEQACKLEINNVDISMPQNLAANRRYDKIREDVKVATDICKENKVEVRYILEYRMFDHHCLKKICEIFENHGVKYVYPSSGYFIDNLADNILASIFLHQNSKDLNVISTGNLWNEKHFETLVKSGLFGFRTYSIHSLESFLRFNSANKHP
jgi:deoxyribose-phosphate aldolase